MKKHTLVLLVFIILLPAFSWAEDFLGAPVMPGTKVLNKTPSRLELKAESTHDEVLSFYKAALKDLPDIKYRNWKDATYIEDDGRLKWHSITISKGEGKETSIVIVKDNWTWIIGTLVLRFVAVFVVLLILFVFMNLSGGIISRLVKKSEEKKA